MASSTKLIPQFETTYYLGLFYRVYLTILSSQTLDVVTVEPIPFLEAVQEFAPGLMRLVIVFRIGE